MIAFFNKDAIIFTGVMTKGKRRKGQNKAKSKVVSRLVLGLISIAVIAGGYFYYSQPTPDGPIVTVYRSPT